MIRKEEHHSNDEKAFLIGKRGVAFRIKTWREMRALYGMHEHKMAVGIRAYLMPTREIIFSYIRIPDTEMIYTEHMDYFGGKIYLARDVKNHRVYPATTGSSHHDKVKGGERDPYNIHNWCFTTDMIDIVWDFTTAEELCNQKRL